jgi:hypothetical protein
MIRRANTEEKLNELIEIARQQSPNNRSLQNLDGNNQTNTYTIKTKINKESEKSETLTQEIESEIDLLWSDIFVCGYGANRPNQIGLNPEEIGELDWFCSDIICYPERLLNLVNRFRAAGTVKNFVCTIKYQAETDWEQTLKFLEIPGSRIVHLHHNKHEVTWFLKGAK